MAQPAPTMRPRPATPRPAPAMRPRPALLLGLLLLCAAAPALGQTDEQLVKALIAKVDALAGSVAALDGRLEHQGKAVSDLTQTLADPTCAALDHVTTRLAATCPATPATTDPCLQLAASALGRAQCDGPWVVLQSRTVGDVLFNKSWADYSAGFGQVDGDQWLGLDAIHQLCPPAKPCELRVELTYTGTCTYSTCVPRTPDGRYVAVYRKFAVADANDKYRLTIGEYSGTASTAGDALAQQDGAAFSTRDADNDGLPRRSCSVSGSGGGWWYAHAHCGLTRLNEGFGARDRQGILWSSVTGWFDNAASSRMLVRVAA